MADLKKAGKEVSLYSLTRIIPMALGFISLPIFTRIFTPEQYGMMALAQNTANYIATFGLAWLGSSYLRFYLSYKKKDEENKLNSTYLISLIVILVILVTSYLLFFFLTSSLDIFEKELLKLFYLASLLLVFNALLNFFQTYFRTVRMVKSYTVTSISNDLLTLLAALFFVVVFNMGPAGVIIGSSIVSIVITLIISLILFKKKMQIRLKYFDKKILSEAFRYGAPLIFAGFSGWILRYSDRYIIAATRDATEVGLYSVAYNLSDKTIMMVLGAITLATTPILIETWEKEGKKETERVLRAFSKYLYMLLLPSTAGLIVIAPRLMGFFIGRDFQQGLLAMQIVAAGVFFYGLYQFAFTGLYVEKKTIQIAINLLVIGIINMVLNLVFIPRYGYNVAAITTVISYLLIFLASYFQTRKIIRWEIELSSFLKITAASIIMTLVIFLATRTFSDTILATLLIVMLGLVVYYLALYSLGAIKEENLLIKRYVKKRLQR
jgi:O-antigen/teichoic acid export membrane protein